MRLHGYPIILITIHIPRLPSDRCQQIFLIFHILTPLPVTKTFIQLSGPLSSGKAKSAFGMYLRQHWDTLTMNTIAKPSLSTRKALSVITMKGAFPWDEVKGMQKTKTKSLRRWYLTVYVRYSLYDVYTIYFSSVRTSSTVSFMIRQSCSLLWSILKQSHLERISLILSRSPSAYSISLFFSGSRLILFFSVKSIPTILSLIIFPFFSPLLNYSRLYA